MVVGSEKVARQVEVIDFIPLWREHYDLVVKRCDFESRPARATIAILESEIMREEFAGPGGYDTSGMGEIVSMG